MKDFLVRKREVWIQYVRITAENEQDAIAKVEDGDGDEEENLFEYSHTMDPDRWDVSEFMANP